MLAEQFPPVDLGKILELVKNKAIMVDAPPLPEQICSDPDDDKFLACACVSKCNLIVSGDKHLLQVSGHSGIRVLKPRQFVDEYP
jgi:putative PIN family toxin of toxin-antitoxin system